MLSRKQVSNLPAGPPRRRQRPTDILCLLLFFVSLGTLGYITYRALQPPSSLSRVINGLDSQHDICGVDNSATGEPLTVQVTVGRPSPLARLWPFWDSPPPRNITVLRGGRDHTARPLLYYTFPVGGISGVPTAAVCVSECPHPPLSSNHTATLDSNPAHYVCTGRYYGTTADRCRTSSAIPSTAIGGGNGNGTTSTTTVPTGCEAPNTDLLFSTVGNDELNKCHDPMQECTVCFPPYRTVQLMNVCLPDPKNALDTFSTLVTAFAAVGASTDGQLSIEELHWMRSFVASAPHLVWEDLVLSAPIIGGCIGFAALFGAIWMLLVRFFAHIMVWTTVVSFAAGIGIGAYYMWITQRSMKASPRYESDDMFRQQADILFYSFYGVAAIGVFYSIGVVTLHRKIIIAVKVMKEASRAVAAQPATLLLPILTLLVSLAIVSGSAYVGALLASTGELVRAQPGFGHLHVPLETWGWGALLVFGTLWLLCFVRHVQHCAIAGTLSSWYFGVDGGSACLGSLSRVLTQHAGSVAYGSLLITLLQMVRLIVLAVMKRAKVCAGDSSFAKLACCCVACCLGCIEKTVRYLSRNAYIIMMIRGTSFCSSASEAVGLLTKHMVKVALVRSIGAGFLLLGKVFIAAGAAAIGALFLLTQPPYKEELFSVVPAVVAITIGAWIVGTGFMSVYNVAVDTIFLCYALDLDSVKEGQQRKGPASVNALIEETAERDDEYDEAPPARGSSSRRSRGSSTRQGSGANVGVMCVAAAGGTNPFGEVSTGQLAETSSTRYAANVELSDGTSGRQRGRSGRV